MNVSDRESAQSNIFLQVILALGVQAVHSSSHGVCVSYTA